MVGLVHFSYFLPVTGKNRGFRVLSPAPPPRWGRMVLAISKKTKDRELPLEAYPPIARGGGVVFFFSPPPPPLRRGGVVLATSRKTRDKELPLGAYPP